jgi:hypothetical protein
MSTISKFLPLVPDNFSTQISSATVSTTDLSVNLDSTSGLPTEGVGQFFKKDVDGEIVAGSVEFVHWTNVSGNTITFSDTDDRGITGSDSGAQAYAADDYFEVWASSYHTSYGGLIEHKTTGTHSDITADSLVVTGATTLTGGITQSWDGWITATDTWTYASATTFTIAGVDRTALFPKGTKIKLTQTTAKYFYVVGSAFSTNTTITVTGGSDYTLADAAITSPNYSYMDTPQGFPQWFAFTPAWTNITVGNGTNTGSFCVSGQTVFIRVDFGFGSSSSIDGAVTLTFPVTINTNIAINTVIGQISVKDGSAAPMQGQILANGGLRIGNSSGTYLGSSVFSSTVPMTWDSSDLMGITATYQMA